jgi:hypothetical protein
MKETLKANGFINLDLPKLKRPVYVRWTDWQKETSSRGRKKIIIDI